MNGPIERELSLLEGNETNEINASGQLGFEVKIEGRDLRQIIGRAEDVLMTVDRQVARGWPAAAKWREVLPEWFVNACAPEMTESESEAWLKRWDGMSEEERAIEESSKSWSLLDWIYWMHPEHRTWFWQGTDASSGRVRVACDSWPFPSGYLFWLLKAAGAERMEFLD